MRTLATFPCPPACGFLDEGITFLPAFLEGACNHCQNCNWNQDIVDIYHLAGLYDETMVTLERVVAV